jgi:hypothetical protein
MCVNVLYDYLFMYYLVMMGRSYCCVVCNVDKFWKEELLKTFVERLMH